MRKNKILVFIVATVIIGCNNELDLDKVPQKMVINSAFGPDSTLKVEIIENSPMLSYEHVKYIENAQVALFENGEFVDYLRYEKDDYYDSIWMPIGIQENYYTLDNYKAKAGNTYSLEITCDGYPDVNTSDIIPNQTDIISVDTNWIVTRDDFGLDYELAINITFRDNPNERNFYLIENFAYGYSYDPYSPESPPNKISIYPLVRCKDPVVEFILTDYNFKYIFSDDAINGQMYDFELICYNILFEGADFYVKLYSISESYYLYLKSYYDQFEAKKDFFAEPVQVYSNIEGGRGIFVGYNISVDSFYVEWPSTK